MKKNILALLIALALTLALPTALAGGLPVPPSTPAPAAPAAPAALPNPGTFLQAPGECAQADYEYDGTTWAVWYYPQGSDWGTPISAWLKTCEDAGFTWNPDSIEGQQCYAIAAGEFKAVLVPNYYGQIMLMVETGLELEPYQKAVKAPLEANQVRVKYNGRDYGVFRVTDPLWRKELFVGMSFNLADAPISHISLAMPLGTASGDSFHITSDTVPNYFHLKVDSEDYVYNLSQGYNYLKDHDKLVTDDDYCDVSLLRLDSNVAIGTLKGVFDSGNTTLELEFYVDNNA